MLQSVSRQSVSRQSSRVSISPGQPEIEGVNRDVSRVGWSDVSSRIAKAHSGSDAVLESLISETHFACSRMVVIASWINALDNPEIAVTAKTVRALVPGQPAIMVTMRRWINSSTLHAETLYCTDEFFASLAVARNAFDMFTGEATQIGYVRAGILHRTVLAASWRFAAERARDAIDAQAAEIALKLPDIYSENAKVLKVLIGDVKAGGSPCLNTDGTIALPDLPNQRRSARLVLLENCLVETARKTFKAFARDVCEGGPRAFTSAANGDWAAGDDNASDGANIWWPGCVV